MKRAVMSSMASKFMVHLCDHHLLPKIAVLRLITLIVALLCMHDIESPIRINCESVAKHHGWHPRRGSYLVLASDQNLCKCFGMMSPHRFLWLVAVMIMQS